MHARRRRPYSSPVGLKPFCPSFEFGLDESVSLRPGSLMRFPTVVTNPRLGRPALHIGKGHPVLTGCPCGLARDQPSRTASATISSLICLSTRTPPRHSP